MEQKMLTDRQEALLALLQNTYAIDDTQYLSSKEIQSLVPGYDARDAYKEINRDYHAINNDPEVPNIIIADRVHGYKIATEAEAKTYAEKKAISLRKGFGRLGRVVRKAKLEGVMDILTEEFHKPFEVSKGTN